jgi:hypothetical protein
VASFVVCNLLPLLLGLLGLVFQFDRDKRGSWLVFLLFILTGVAIVVYLNQPPYQVRERDYAYAGSFYAFSIWIGFAVAAIYSWVDSALKGKGSVVTAAVTTAACLGVPALMCAQEWDDHDRSNRYTAVEVARNYLNSVEKNGLLETAYRLKKGVITFSPLAQGLLTNRYLNGIPEDSRIARDHRFLKESALTPEKLSQIRALNAIAERRGQTLAEMSLAWLLAKKEVTSVLVGASKPSQIDDDIKALSNIAFTKEELLEIDAISNPKKA